MLQERKIGGQVMVKAGLVKLFQGACLELSINFKEIVSLPMGIFESKIRS